MPFTVEQFLEVFAAYNRTVYPMQLILAFAALFAIFSAIKTGKNSSRIISLILSFFWLWMGAVYHLSFFSRINRAAFFFGTLFIVQAAIFFYAGVLKKELSFRFRSDAGGVIGIFLLLYALVFYPLLGIVFGHIYPQTATFGLPCPTTIFTFGILLWTGKKVPRYVLPIPFLWSLIGFSAAFLLGIYEDVGLLLAAIIGVTVLIWRNRLKLRRPENNQKVSSI